MTRKTGSLENEMRTRRHYCTSSRDDQKDEKHRLCDMVSSRSQLPVFNEEGRKRMAVPTSRARRRSLSEWSAGCENYDIFLMSPMLMICW